MKMCYSVVKTQIWESEREYVGGILFLSLPNLSGLINCSTQYGRVKANYILSADKERRSLPPNNLEALLCSVHSTFGGQTLCRQNISMFFGCPRRG